MTTILQYPFTHHPCYADTRNALWARIHLPVATYCNVKCIFCDHNLGSSCHTSKPGYASRVLTPEEAVECAMRELSEDPRLRIVAISGPGEPLANRETYATLQGLRDRGMDVRFCLSTNGTLLEEAVGMLCNLDVSTVSVSMSTQSYDIASNLYEWATINGRILQGASMAREIVTRQLRGIRTAADAGICVKVNTILIPELNGSDIVSLSRRISDVGAQIQNIVPLISCGARSSLRAPSTRELDVARSAASSNIRQFMHCRQCRSDVVGIPGSDRVL